MLNSTKGLNDSVYGSVIAESAVYALRASVLLAGAEKPVPASRIAARLGAPRQYLEKVLGIMARSGSVVSQRGARGGFRLARPAEETVLATIIAPFDSVASQPKCLLEARACDGVQECAAHPYWSGVAQGIYAFFNTTTVAELAVNARAAEKPQKSRGSRICRCC